MLRADATIVGAVRRTHPSSIAYSQLAGITVEERFNRAMSNFDSNETIQFTSSKPVYDFYVAGPYETAEQVESMERLRRCSTTAA